MMFVTVFFGIYCISEHSLVYVNAGHEDPVIYQGAQKEYALCSEEHDFVLGINPDAQFTERTLHLSPGDKLFLYTDGVTEAKNEKDEMFGEERMVSGLNEYRSLSGEELLTGMRKRIADFAGEAAQFDDVTMLLMETGEEAGENGDYKNYGEQC